MRRHHRGVRQHQRARGERPRLRLPGAGGLRGVVLPRVPDRRAQHDQGARRNLRLGQRLRKISKSFERETMTNGTAATQVRWWVPGDWNGFFGLFTNVVLNVIVLTGLCLGVVQLPGDVVFGRILPALGIALPLGNLYYAYLAYKLARKEGRTDVTAMPYGPSVPHMFIVVFVIMLPVYLKTKDPMLAWQAGLAWAFIIGVIVLAGVFVGPWIRAHTPRAAMLGTLAGISIAFISLRPAFQMWEVPWIAFIAFAIVLISWTANVRLPWGLPGGLVAVIVGMVVGWIAYFFGW